MIAIDVGNTTTAIGFFEGKRKTNHWRIKTDAFRQCDEYELLLRQFLQPHSTSVKDQDLMMVSSVVPNVTEQLLGLKKYCDVYVITHETPISFEIDLSDPSSLGTDRIIDMEAALTKYGAPVIVVDTGTATTISVINRERHFIGGMIAPGLRISIEALSRSAARIHRHETVSPERCIGRNTSEAIASGTLLGHAVMIEGLVRKALVELGEDAAIVCTGGATEWISPHFDLPIQVDPDLTIEGLNILYGQMKKGGF